MTKAEKEAKRLEAQESLRNLFAGPGIGTVGEWDGVGPHAVMVQRVQIRGVFRHVSRNGMSRVIMPLVVVDGEIVHIGRRVAKALDWRYSDTHDGVIVSGVGMDMLFHLVSTLSVTLYGSGHDYDLAYRWLS